MVRHGAGSFGRVLFIVSFDELAPDYYLLLRAQILWK